MSNGYFMELSNLRFEVLPGGASPDDIRDALDGWMPRGKSVFARMENRWMGKEQFDYVLITDDILYFARMSHELQPRLLSMKCFKTAELQAFAFVLDHAATKDPSETPQIRLMLNDGGRIKLMFDKTAEAEALRHMKDLAAKNCFIC